jgi:uncharacterized membrane-anchored protein
MDKSSPRRWLWTGAAMFWCAVVALVVSVIAFGTHAPRFVSVIFFVLMLLCAVAGFILIGIGASKARKENQELSARAIARARARRD